MAPGGGTNLRGVEDRLVARGADKGGGIGREVGVLLDSGREEVDVLWEKRGTA